MPRSTDQFEYTPEQIVFDLVRVRMLHGWVVDPQDPASVAVLGNLTYNQLIEKLIEFTALQSEMTLQETREESPAHEPAVVEEEPMALGSTPAADPDLDHAAAPEGPHFVMVNPAPAPDANGRELAPAPAPVQEVVDEDVGGVAVAPVPEDDGHAHAPPPYEVLAPAPVTESAPAGPQPSSAPGVSQTGPVAPTELTESEREERERVLREGAVVQEFLNSTASQLTYTGLVELHQTMHDGELCAFFRNNHFSTLYKRDGELYVLVTDLGYLHEQAVWEKLDGTDGDTTLYRADFSVCPLSERQRDHEICAIQGDVVPEDDIPPEVIAESLAASGQGPPVATAVVVQPGQTPPADPSGDADLALAMQLQAEMDSEAREARRQELEAQQRALEGQRQHPPARSGGRDLDAQPAESGTRPQSSGRQRRQAPPSREGQQQRPGEEKRGPNCVIS